MTTTGFSKTRDSLVEDYKTRRLEDWKTGQPVSKHNINDIINSISCVGLYYII